MSKYLVIVESPAKARTISSILGKDYDVTSSMGHLVDLPSSKIAIDVDNDFEPRYRIIPGKQKIITELKKKAKGKKIVYLATDPDREGEAISWHIKQRLEKTAKVFKRVVFHEITEEAIKEAFNEPSEIDENKVNARLARRILDRIVGYSLSPLLWKTIIRGLSAGRVQSIALRFIVEREGQIEAFVSQTTYSVQATFKCNGEIFEGKLTSFNGKDKIIFNDKPSALSCIEEIKKMQFNVEKIITKQTRRKPPTPHITSALQQDAFSRIRFSAQRTMIVAQKLYEGIQIGEKIVGLITYMRTDSFHVSPKAKKEAAVFIKDTYGAQYLSSKEYAHKSKKGAQFAHEAIRPTQSMRKPEDLVAYLSQDESRLYELIWRRFIASLMKEALYENNKAIISSSGVKFTAEGRKILFDGFLKVSGSELEQDTLPHLEKGAVVTIEGCEVIEHITKPPPRYNDASLVKILEEKGIGRPSTYAPTMYTLVRRNYVERQKRCFMPTTLGIKVSNLLVSKFPGIINEDFTASMEKDLDEVANGDMQWRKILENFYPSFKVKVDEAIGAAVKEVEYSDKKCTQCDGKMVFKWSRRGRFLSCEHFPKCRYAESITTGVQCPDCKKGSLIERRNRRGQKFYGCSGYPECRHTTQKLPGSDEDDDSADTGSDSSDSQSANE
jgi:DNA topoisomerase I